jgi:transposase
MDIIYRRCCGLDVHKKLIVACLRNGNQAQLRKFDTLTESLRELCQWLLENNCQMIAMESTGSYWKPVYNILELHGLEAMVVNAHYIKNVPGRKTDAKDAEWIAQILQHGLVKASYIPGREQRELREIVRYRKNLAEERSREINRLEKTLEGANIKLSSYVSDLTGASSRRLINEAISGGVTATNISMLLHRSMQIKKEVLLKAMDAVMSATQKYLVKAVMDHIDDMTGRIDDMGGFIDQQMEKYGDEIDKLNEIPGVGKISAETILAETGVDMARFRTAASLASWAGLCPGNNQSAGKRKSSKTNHGNRHLKTALIQAAKAAAKKKGSFFHAQYQRIVVRRGANRATVAVAHSILIAIYHILKGCVSFKDLGADYYNQFNKANKARYYIKKLQELGMPTSVPSAT